MTETPGGPALAKVWSMQAPARSREDAKRGSGRGAGSSRIGKLKRIRWTADNDVMDERRTDPRLLCADMVEISWKDSGGRTRHATALLEDIAVHGACLQLDRALPLHIEIT